MGNEISYDEMAEAAETSKKRRDLGLFAKDIARQCVGMDIAQKSIAKGVYHEGMVYTAAQLRGAGVKIDEHVPDHTKFTLSTDRAGRA